MEIINICILENLLKDITVSRLAQFLLICASLIIDRFNCIKSINQANITVKRTELVTFLCEQHFLQHLKVEASKKKEHLSQLQRILSDSPWGEVNLRAIPMVASQSLAMGNGSIKASQAEENSCLAAIHRDHPSLDTETLRQETNLINMIAVCKLLIFVFPYTYCTYTQHILVYILYKYKLHFQ